MDIIDNPVVEPLLTSLWTPRPYNESRRNTPSESVKPSDPKTISQIKASKYRRILEHISEPVIEYSKSTGDDTASYYLGYAIANCVRAECYGKPDEWRLALDTSIKFISERLTSIHGDDFALASSTVAAIKNGFFTICHNYIPAEDRGTYIKRYRQREYLPLDEARLRVESLMFDAAKLERRGSYYVLAVDTSGGKTEAALKAIKQNAGYVVYAVPTMKLAIEVLERARNMGINADFRPTRGGKDIDNERTCRNMSSDGVTTMAQAYGQTGGYVGMNKNICDAHCPLRPGCRYFTNMFNAPRLVIITHEQLRTHKTFFWEDKEDVKGEDFTPIQPDLLIMDESGESLIATGLVFNSDNSISSTETKVHFAFIEDQLAGLLPNAVKRIIERYPSPGRTSIFLDFNDLDANDFTNAAFAEKINKRFIAKPPEFEGTPTVDYILQRVANERNLRKSVHSSSPYFDATQKQTLGARELVIRLKEEWESRAAAISRGEPISSFLPFKIEFAKPSGDAPDRKHVLVSLAAPPVDKSWLGASTTVIKISATPPLSEVVEYLFQARPEGRNIEELGDIGVIRHENKRVNVVYDASTSASSMKLGRTEFKSDSATGKVREFTPNLANLNRLQAHAKAIIDRAPDGSKTSLFVRQADQFMFSDFANTGNAKPVDLATQGGNIGQDKWSGHTTAISFGTLLPPPDTMIRLAETLIGKSIKTYVPGYYMEDWLIETDDGEKVMSLPTHEHPLVARLAQHKYNSTIEQEGVGRLFRRNDDVPQTVWHYGPFLSSSPNVKYVSIKDVEETFGIGSRGQIAMLFNKGLFAPPAWVFTRQPFGAEYPTKKAAQRALERFLVDCNCQDELRDWLRVGIVPCAATDHRQMFIQYDPSLIEDIGALINMVERDYCLRIEQPFIPLQVVKADW